MSTYDLGGSYWNLCLTGAGLTLRKKKKKKKTTMWLTTIFASDFIKMEAATLFGHHLGTS
jgi:hypothetical protein